MPEAPTTVRRPMYRGEDFSYYAAPSAGVDYYEETYPRSCLYVPRSGQVTNLDLDGITKQGKRARTALYRFIGTSGLLYVGIAVQPEPRWRCHRDEKPWWGDVLAKTIDWHEDRYEAEIAEYLAIIRERPLHNALLTYPDRWKAERAIAFSGIEQRFSSTWREPPQLTYRALREAA
ncbi:hypothetical protein [Streptomyces sp. NPDC001652]|uniref:hypothetical protein n=1 Tax=Streptomyces sp. NPDC001652 TaxID=3154393 RepID=UPI0033330005